MYSKVSFLKERKILDSGGKVQILTDINKLIHEPARLIIISLLYVVESADFVWIKGQSELTDGNLSSHLSKLESAGYVTVEKSIKNKKTNTLLKLSNGGRKAFEEYRKKLTQILGNPDN